MQQQQQTTSGYEPKSMRISAVDDLKQSNVNALSDLERRNGRFVRFAINSYGYIVYRYMKPSR